MSVLAVGHLPDGVEEVPSASSVWDLSAKMYSKVFPPLSWIVQPAAAWALFTAGARGRWLRT